MDSCLSLRKWDKIASFVKTEFQLLIDNKDIMHFFVKVRIPFFTVIGNLMGIELCLPENLSNTAYGRCRHTRISLGLGNGIYILCQAGRIP